MTNMRTMILLFSLVLSHLVTAQKHEETIKKSLNFPSQSSDNRLIVANVYGPISVEAYNGNEVKVEVVKTIEADTQSDLDKGKKEVDLKVEKRDEKIFLYAETPFSEYNIDKEQFRHSENHRGDRRKYDYRMKFTIKVPVNTNLKVTAINDADIYVKGVQPKKIEVNSINGGIKMENIAGETYANALNEDIDISYASVPTSESTFKALNGDINIEVRGSLDADVYFKSMNGDFYTNIEDVKPTTNTAFKRKEGRKGVKYEIDAKDKFQLGDGGVALNFDLLNGDVTLRQK